VTFSEFHLSAPFSYHHSTKEVPLNLILAGH